jgi:hypothetical protein
LKVKEEILILKIHNGLKDWKNFYEATRGNWKINKARLTHVKYVIGINRGKVVCAFEPIKWMIIEEGSDAGRKRFDGKEVTSELLKNFQDNEQSLLRRFGSCQAVAYCYMNDISLPGD